MKRITDTFNDDLRTSMIVSHWILLGMKNISDKGCRGYQNILCSITFFFFENRAVYEIMWKNIVQPGRPRMTIRACLILQTHTHLQHVIPIAFPLQQWLHERASVLRYTYTVCLVFHDSFFTQVHISNEHSVLLQTLWTRAELLGMRHNR